MPLADRWCLEKVAGITGLPDEPGCRDRGEPAKMPEVVVVPHPDPPAEPPRVTRGFRIEASDLREHSYTERCAKCDALRAGRVVGTGHSAACRERFRNVFTERADGRVERAAERRDGAAGPCAAPEQPDADMEEHGPDDEGAMEGAAAPETPQFAPRTPQAGAAAPETPRAAPETPQFAPRTPPAQWPAPDTPTTVADDLSDADDDLPMMTVVRARRWTDEEGSEDDKWTDFVPGATAAVAAATAAATAAVATATTIGSRSSVELAEDVADAVNRGAVQRLSA